MCRQLAMLPLWYSTLKLVFLSANILGTPCEDLTYLVISVLNKLVKNGTNRVYEDEATISCNDGWQYPDGSRDFTIKCNASGMWNTTAPNCQSEFFFF